MGAIVSASDLGSTNTAITYSLVPSTDANNFKIEKLGDGRGQIRSKVKFDYETQKQYVFEVQAQDSYGADKLTGKAMVRISVTDANDNCPTVDHEHVNVNISEGTAVGTIVDIIKAADIDSDVNAKLQFSTSAES